MARKRRRKTAKRRKSTGAKRKKRKSTKRRGHVPLAILERRERKLRKIIKSRGGSVS